LQRGEKLDPKNVDHPLTGGWVGFRDCHVKPNLVLIAYFGDCDRSFPLFFKQVVVFFTI
ncbi:type II toxin-antitoxin system mRNA interferase toxin, RelE/StbE family, partial [Vibrio cincinnatiensis]|uniref:type II toxin-antitoxin system mRNA interferase toxin, RelE/StbE family n=1 Tax=Vibrio cincinnatiensis TaxID=675 RepID=UPI001EDEB1B9